MLLHWLCCCCCCVDLPLGPAALPSHLWLLLAGTGKSLDVELNVWPV